MVNLIDILKTLSRDTAVPAVDHQLIMSILEKVKVKKGEIIVRQGTICDSIYYIEKGLIRQYYIKDDGKEITEHFGQSGEYFTAAESMVLKTPSLFESVALENTILLRIKKESLETLGDKYLVIEHEYRNMLHFALVLTQLRMRSIQFETALQRYQDLKKNKPYVIQRASSVHIASYLGITPETLSRIKSM
jgi:CRP-like cAMP-binding protein